MINPCEKCIVKVMCGQVCPQKHNYKRILLSGLRDLSAAHSHYNFRGIPKNIQNQIFLYRRKIKENQDETSEILSRTGDNKDTGM